ncbi:hypothetical protein OEB99_18275 [Actinotalea sp. M2MS4P-6]|uniref:hypothetical protein n=1 Tax=Actinotalea sp. M2MS4P-6 TaxID=2983762 RepID=UPI0021E4C97D|nr:hypothetical protein [Actinotalea sp. M2MS4P-6]MCV2396261.1 hypothetical protein [Actinotalea sp. M2MS4P-6]
MIISQVDPFARFGTQVPYTVSARSASDGTVVEDDGAMGWQHRVNTGPGMDEPLTAGTQFSVDVDLGSDFTTTRDAQTLCFYSSDSHPRSSDQIWVNGVAYDLELDRQLTIYGGRYLIGFTGSWYTWDRSCDGLSTLPDGAIHDGINHFALETQGHIQIGAVFIESRPHYTPPDPGDGGGGGGGPILT